MRLLPFLLALPLAGSLLATPLAHDGVRIALKYEKDQVLRYRSTLTMEQTVSGPTEITTRNETAQVFAQNVKEVDKEGVATLACEWEAVRMKVEAGGGVTIDYDSTDPKSTPPEGLAGFAKLVGLGFEMQVKQNGEIVRLKGMKEALDALFEGSDPGVAVMKQMFQGILDDDNMKRTFEATVWPEHELKEDEVWSRDVAMKLGPLGEATLKYEYTFRGIVDEGGERCAKLDIAVVMKFGDEIDTSNMPGAEQLDIELDVKDSKGSGELYFAIDKGRLVRTTMDQDVEFSMNMKAKEAIPGFPEEGLDIGFDMSTKVEMRLLGKDDPPFGEARSDAKK
ncbi:MAG: hypothetical protein HZA53_11575 [Planctomycetes bacterium]|nr:hypothetical protein [Planctomycetota bacterium]